MNARERRRAIMAVLEGAKGPVSGSALAREVGVSRQIVVQDIALLRADGHDIVATNRGYVLQEAPSSPAVPTRLVKVRHSVEQAGDELTSIVDAGGAVLNVIVNHRVYGKITADLDIRNRRDVERYLRDIESGKSFPLLTVTSGYHFHRIAAEDEQTLDDRGDAQGKRLPSRPDALRRRFVLVDAASISCGEIVPKIGIQDIIQELFHRNCQGSRSKLAAHICKRRPPRRCGSLLFCARCTFECASGGVVTPRRSR